jgi:DNA-binding NarL/FixJ family response regulator
MYSSFGRKKDMIILIIEDQDKRFYTIIQRLKTYARRSKNGYKIIVKNNYKDSINFYSQNYENIGLVVLDVRMTGNINDEIVGTQNDKAIGIKIYHEIKKKKENQEIIFWTVLSKGQLEEEGIVVDDDKYIVKSSDFFIFFSKIDNCLQSNFAEMFEGEFEDINTPEGE